MARNLLLAALLGGIIGKTGAIPLSGYFCASCPSSPNPTQLINDIPKAYSTVIFGEVPNETTTRLRPPHNLVFAHCSIYRLQSRRYGR